MALIDDLISYWKMDEASGNALDAHGTNELTDTNTVGAAAGKINGARDFEASNSEYFTIADNASLSFSGNDPFTIAAWVNLESLTSSNVLAKFNAAGDTGGYFLRYHAGDGVFEFRVGADDGANGTNIARVTASNFGTPSTGTWYHLVAWHDPVNDVIGIAVNDGTPNTTAHATGVFDDAASFSIGRLGDFDGQYWDGLIDEVGIWNRVLTSGERTSLNNGGSGLAYPFSASATSRPLFRRPTRFFTRRF